MLLLRNARVFVSKPLLAMSGGSRHVSDIACHASKKIWIGEATSASSDAFFSQRLSGGLSASQRSAALRQRVAAGAQLPARRCAFDASPCMSELVSVQCPQPCCVSMIHWRLLGTDANITLPNCGWSAGPLLPVRLHVRFRAAF